MKPGRDIPEAGSMTERKSGGTHSRGCSDSMFAPRYMEIASFMRAPVIKDLSAFDLAMVGVPYDGAVTNRPARTSIVTSAIPIPSTFLSIPFDKNQIMIERKNTMIMSY